MLKPAINVGNSLHFVACTPAKTDWPDTYKVIKVKPETIELLRLKQKTSEDKTQERSDKET
jgi:hypothetical protein